MFSHITEGFKVTSINLITFAFLDQISIRGALEVAVLLSVLTFNGIKIYQALRHKKSRENITE